MRNAGRSLARSESGSRIAGGVVVAVLGYVAMLGALPAPSLGAASGGTRSCGFVRAVPYPHGHHDRWRIYVKGAASCASATAALDAVLHNKATPHVGTDFNTSYFTSAAGPVTSYRWGPIPAGARGTGRTAPEPWRVIAPSGLAARRESPASMCRDGASSRVWV